MSNWHKQRGVTETGPQVIALGERMTKKEIEAWEAKDSQEKVSGFTYEFWTPDPFAALEPAPHPWELGCDCSSCRMVTDLLERGQMPDSDRYAAERRRLNLDMETRKKVLDRLVSYQRIKPYDAS